MWVQVPSSARNKRINSKELVLCFARKGTFTQQLCCVGSGIHTRLARCHGSSSVHPWLALGSLNEVLPSLCSPEHATTKLGNTSLSSHSSPSALLKVPLFLRKKRINSNELFFVARKGTLTQQLRKWFKISALRPLYLYIFAPIAHKYIS